jgi:hypothetical protein
MSSPMFTKDWVYNLEEVPPSSEAGRVIALALSFSGIACLFVVLRLGVRWRSTQAIGVGINHLLSESPADSVVVRRLCYYC